mmetsp:Transcript_12987/g.32985  ORF Transcript_12987/g.32985 Transcript_12987/m.32985 type:complete len:99 (-) Transcript_12987:937-1233(-)
MLPRLKCHKLHKPLRPQPRRYSSEIGNCQVAAHTFDMIAKIVGFGLILCWMNEATARLRASPATGVTYFSSLGCVELASFLGVCEKVMSFVLVKLMFE